jgi:glycosyltransferase involved in cell wall biosynthesis
MPVYRPDPGFLIEAIDSVIAQSLPDWELIIVEDPSDRTGREVLQRYRDPRIRYILNEQRTGLARQHNRAVAEARAPLIARFDADDVCEPARLEMQAAYLDAHPDIDVVACQLKIIDDTGSQIGSRHYPQQHDEIVRTMRRYNPISGSNVMFRSKIPADIGGWREGIDLPAQDYEWYSRVAKRGYRFAILPDYLLRYRRHGSQIKQKKLRGTILTTLEVKRRYWLKSMDPVSLGLFACEAAMLVLPASVVLWLFGRVRYK